MIAAMLFAGLVGSVYPAQVCSPGDPPPSITGKTTTRVLPDLWAVRKYCAANGYTPPSGTFLNGCYLHRTDEVVVTADAGRAFAAALERHERWHAAGYEHPGSLDGCGVEWIKRRDAK